MANLRVAEFYCGIGGLHFALKRVFPSAHVVAAFDVDREGNAVYALNTGLQPTKVDIGTLSVSYLESLSASLWLLSPPCQPFTRQGHKRDSEDPRTASFLALLKKLQEMDLSHGPEAILLENVVGFDQSETRNQMLTTFQSCQLTAIQEFILSPDQLGIPYSRPRYFCLARRQPFPIQSTEITRQPHFLPQGRIQLLREFLEEGVAEGDGYDVPVRFLDQCSEVLNVVSEESTLLNCFTKSYGGRYFKGTGSVLATKHSEWIPAVGRLQSLCCQREQSHIPLQDLSQELPPDFRTEVMEQGGLGFDERRLAVRSVLSKLLREMGIRYLTPREVAALHSFPSEFQFPSEMSLKRQYALLGNSLSVAIVAELIRHLCSGHQGVM